MMIRWIMAVLAGILFFTDCSFSTGNRIPMADSRTDDSLKQLAYYAMQRDSMLHCFVIADSLAKSLEVRWQAMDSVYNEVIGLLPDKIVYSPAMKEWLTNKLSGIVFPEEEIHCSMDKTCGISSEYRMDHIHFSFERKEESLFLKNITDGDFRELVLSEITTCSFWPVISRRDIYRFTSKQFNRAPAGDFSAVVKYVYNYICCLVDCMDREQMDNPGRVETELLTWACRAYGIPIGIQMRVGDAERQKATYFNFYKDTLRKVHRFQACREGVLSEYSCMAANGRALNIYQFDSQVNKQSPSFLRNGKEEIPEIFSSPYVRDVTRRYKSAFSVRMKLDLSTDHHLVWLYTPDTGKEGLEPVSWGKVYADGDSVVFENLLPGGLYLPMLSGKNKIPALSPFFTVGKECVSIPQILKRVEGKLTRIRLERTAPLKSQEIKRLQEMAGIELYGANRADFQDQEMLCRLNGCKKGGLQRILLHGRPYRYYRIDSGKKGKRLNIENMEWVSRSKPRRGRYTESMDGEKGFRLLGRIVGTVEDSTLLYPKWNYAARGKVDFEFEESVKADELLFRPVTENNEVRRGEDYMLTYWNGIEWTKYAEIRALHDYIVLEDLPQDRLYRFTNLNRKTFERCFICYNGEVVFIDPQEFSTFCKNRGVELTVGKR